MNNSRRSQVITAGVHRSPNRAMLRAVGFTDEDFAKPIVGIAMRTARLPPVMPESMIWHYKRK